MVDRSSSEKNNIISQDQHLLDSTSQDQSPSTPRSRTPSPILSSFSRFNPNTNHENRNNIHLHSDDEDEDEDDSSNNNNNKSYRSNALVKSVDQSGIESLFQMKLKDETTLNFNSNFMSVSSQGKDKAKQRDTDTQTINHTASTSHDGLPDPAASASSSDDDYTSKIDYQAIKTTLDNMSLVSKSSDASEMSMRLNQMVKSLMTHSQRLESNQEVLKKQLESLQIQALSLLTKSLHHSSTFYQSQSILLDQQTNEIERLRCIIGILGDKLSKEKESARISMDSLNKEREREREREAIRERERWKERDWREMLINANAKNKKSVPNPDTNANADAENDGNPSNAEPGRRGVAAGDQPQSQPQPQPRIGIDTATPIENPASSASSTALNAPFTEPEPRKSRVEVRPQNTNLGSPIEVDMELPNPNENTISSLTLNLNSNTTLAPTSVDVGSGSEMMGPPSSRNRSSAAASAPTVNVEAEAGQTQEAPSSASASIFKDIEHSPTPIGGVDLSSSSLATPRLHLPNPTSVSESSQRLGEALELVTQTPLSSTLEASHGTSSSEMTGSNSDQSKTKSSTSDPRFVSSTVVDRLLPVEQGQRSSPTIPCTPTSIPLGREKSKMQAELEAKALSSRDRHSDASEISQIGDTDLTLDRQTLLKERLELVSDKKYLKQRLSDAESQLVRFENELRNVRSILLSKGEFIEITKNKLRNEADYGKALQQVASTLTLTSGQRVKNSAAGPGLNVGASVGFDLGRSPYSMVYLDGKTFAEREKDREISINAQREFERSDASAVNQSTQRHPSTQASTSASVEQDSGLPPASNSRHRDADDLSRDFSLAIRTKIFADKEIRKRNKKPSALMGDAESEHLLLAAKRLRELREFKEKEDSKLRLENRQRHRERRELREREEMERLGSETFSGMDPFYPFPDGGDYEMADAAAENGSRGGLVSPRSNAGSRSQSVTGTGIGDGTGNGGRAVRSNANNLGEFRTVGGAGSSIFPGSQHHSSSPNSAGRVPSSPRKGNGSAGRSSGAGGSERPRTPPKERNILPGSPLKRGGSPIEMLSSTPNLSKHNHNGTAPRTPASIASRAFQTPGTTPGSAMDDLLHAAQTVLTPTGPRAEIDGNDRQRRQPQEMTTGDEVYYSSNSRIAEVSSPGSGIASSSAAAGNHEGLLRSPLGGRIEPSSLRNSSIQAFIPGRRENQMNFSRNRISGTNSPTSGYASDEHLDSGSRKRRRTQTDLGSDVASKATSVGSGSVNGPSLIGQPGMVGRVGTPDSIIRTRARSGTDVNVFHQASSSTQSSGGSTTNSSSLFQFGPIVQGGSAIVPDPQRRIGIGIEIPTSAAHATATAPTASYTSSIPSSESMSTPPNYSSSQPLSSLSALDLLADQAHAAASQNPSQSSENSLSRSQTDEEIGNLDSEDDSESDDEEDENEEDDEQDDLDVDGSQQQDQYEDDDLDAEGEHDPDRTATVPAVKNTTRTKSGRKTRPSRNINGAVDGARDSNKRKRSSKGQGKKEAVDSSTSSSHKAVAKRSTRRKLNIEDPDSKSLGVSSISNGKKSSLDSNQSTNSNHAASSAATNSSTNESQSTFSNANGHKRTKSNNHHSRSASRTGSVDLSNPQKQSPSLSQSSKNKDRDNSQDSKDRDDDERERETMSAQQRGAEKRVPYVRWSEEEDKKLRSAVAQYGQRWELIARSVKTRTYHQCRQRFLLMRRKGAQRVADASQDTNASNPTSKNKRGGGASASDDGPEDEEDDEVT